MTLEDYNGLLAHNKASVRLSNLSPLYVVVSTKRSRTYGVCSFGRARHGPLEGKVSNFFKALPEGSTPVKVLSEWWSPCSTFGTSQIGIALRMLSYHLSFQEDKEK